MALTRINNNSLSAVTSAGIPGHGSLTTFEIWELQSNITADQAPVTGWVRQTSLGDNTTYSGGIFTFPSTGYWLIQASCYFRVVSGSACELNIATTTDGTNYTNQAKAYKEASNTGGQMDSTVSASYIFDVTDTSTHKLRTNFDLNDVNNIFSGFTDGRSTLTIIKLADT